MLGIEIETSSIKVAYIGKKYELTEWEIFEVPEGAIGPEGIIDFDSVINTLLKIPPKFNMKNPKAAFAISGPAYTAVRVIQVPYIDKEEIALNLPFELDKHIPFNVKEVYFDFHILEKLKKRKLNRSPCSSCN